MFRVQDSGYLIERAVLIPLVVYTDRDLKAFGRLDKQIQVKCFPRKLEFQSFLLGYYSEIQQKHFFIREEFIEKSLESGVFKNMEEGDIKEEKDIKYLYPMERLADDEENFVINRSKDIFSCSESETGGFLYPMNSPPCIYTVPEEFE
jgi:hypothetical protein